MPRRVARLEKDLDLEAFKMRRYQESRAASRRGGVIMHAELLETEEERLETPGATIFADSIYSEGDVL